MAALPYMQLYVADYLADTMHLTTEEHGAYLLLIFNYWQTGKSIPKKRLQKIARVPNDRWASVEDSLVEFFNDDGECWVHERIDRDLEVVKETQEQRTRAGKASAEARKRAIATKSQREASACSTPDERPLNGKATNKDTDTDTDTDKDKQQGSAPAGDSPVDVDSGVVLEFPTKDGKGYQLDATFCQELKATYPRIDVDFQLQKARLWLIANPGRQKTRRGMTRFLNNWMGNQKPTAEIHPIQSRHTGFEERDYSQGLIQGVSDDAANF